MLPRTGGNLAASLAASVGQHLVFSILQRYASGRMRKVGTGYWVGLPGLG